VPVAVNINHLSRQRDAEGQFFRHIAEQGHYAGRTKPTPTRQGLYISGIDGNLIDSLNSTEVDTVQQLIKRGIARWNQKTPNALPFRNSNLPDKKYTVAFPKGGMILRETMRDLPEATTPKARHVRHNFDHVWLTADQKKSFMPSEMKLGHTWTIPDSITKKLAAFHLLDQVKGESWPFDPKHVKEATLTAKVTTVGGNKAKIQLMGRVKNVKPPTGERNPFNGRTVDREIVIDVVVRGWIIYDHSKQDFQLFKLLAAGYRSGSDVYNFRWQELDRSAIGFAFEMVEDIPSNRTRPKFANHELYKAD